MGNTTSAYGIKYFDRYDIMMNRPTCATHIIASTTHAYKTF